MSTVEERIAALESEFAEIKKLKGIPRSPGPAGHIDAAVSNAREAVAKDLADTLKKFTDLQDTIRTFDEKLDSRIRQKIDDAAAALQQKMDSFEDNLEDEVAGIVVRILQEYHILDSECRVLDHLQRLKN